MDIYEANDMYLLKELGEKLRLTRLNQNISQEHLSKITGVSRSCIQALEQGSRTISLLNFIKLLRGLQCLENLNIMLPQPEISPIQYAKLLGKQRKRARE